MNRDAEQCKATTPQQKGKVTQHSLPETVIFQRKISWLGWDSNPRPSAFQTMLLQTELPRQLSWLGQILHTNQKASQPDEQVNSKLVHVYFSTLFIVHVFCHGSGLGLVVVILCVLYVVMCCCVMLGLGTGCGGGGRFG